MVEKVIEYSARHPLVVILLAAVGAGIGVHAVIHTPIDAIPDLSENQVIVFADWPGRSPREVEDQVTYPLSVNLQAIAGVKAVRATSEFGFSMINVIFEDDVDFFFARQRVFERLPLAATYLPPDVTPYLAPEATALGQIFWYTVEGPGQDPARLRAIQDWYIRYQLRGVQGVAEVASVGGFPLEYQVDVDPNKLRAYNVSLGEVYSAVARANSAVGGRIVQKANSEYLVRSVGWIRSLDDVKKIVVKSAGGTPVYVEHVASVQLGTALRRASLEKNGNEAVGGVVLMQYGQNPLEVTRRIKQKIVQLQAGLPEGVRIVPFYERTQLIERAIHTVSSTLREEMVVASLAIVLVLWHLRSALVVCLPLPLAVLVSFILMRYVGIPSNIMSLSGIAISIGVLVDSSIVMVENATHHLSSRFGSQPVRGRTTELVLPAMRTVGRPVFFSIMIMLISFLPVFALGGMEGRMFHPLAWTKTFAMLGVAILAVTLVPALIPLLVRGRLRSEQESWIVRSVIEIYLPVLNYLLQHPWPIVLLTGVIFLFGTAPAGWWLLFRLVLAVVLVAGLLAAWRGRGGMRRVVRVAGVLASLLLAAWLADTRMARLGSEFMPPLDEGTILDMPVTVPRASITQVADDLKARNALLRSLPEVELVVGKAGRAETATDPAPPDMIETVINLRPREHWPKRELRFEDAYRQTAAILAEFVGRGWMRPLAAEEQANLLNEVTMFALEDFDHALRQQAQQDYASFQYELAPRLAHRAAQTTVRLLRDGGKLRRPLTAEELDRLSQRLAAAYGAQLAEAPDLPTAERLAQALAQELVQRKVVTARADLLLLHRGWQARLWDEARQALGLEAPTFFTVLLADLEQSRHALWSSHVQQLNGRLFAYGTRHYTRLAAERLRAAATSRGLWTAPPSPPLEDVQQALATSFARTVFFWQRTKDSLLSELDTLVQVPGWGNIWTQPIVNRVDMLATGVRTMVGVKVFGDDLQQIQRVSEDIAAVLRRIRGAADVLPDQIVGEGYLEITIDRQRAARYGVNVGDLQDTIEMALGGKTATITVEGRERFPLRIRYARAFRQDEETVKNLLVAAAGSRTAEMADMGLPGSNRASPQEPLPLAAGQEAASALEAFPNGALQVPLAAIADVQLVEGPSMIKSENGLLRSYVQLNVRGRDIVGFVQEAQRAVAERVVLPPGVYIEWSGQFEHQMRARRTLMVIFPAVVLMIAVILYMTYHDFTDAMLMMLAVPGALAGGVLFVYLFGFNFSVAVWVGMIACFGLATETGVVMLVYLREAVANRGGLENIGSLAELRQAVLEGAAHRLRPKLLTEGTTIIGLAPMLWAMGTGAEIMRPMAAPVIGGILVADEVIDLLLPVLFYLVRARRWQRLKALAPS
jgi:Cu(I)/Ag(I) efflux system membrane protein CusA/SilA